MRCAVAHVAVALVGAQTALLAQDQLPAEEGGEGLCAGFISKLLSNCPPGCAPPPALPTGS